MASAADRSAGALPFLLATPIAVGDDLEFQAALSAAIIVSKVAARRRQNTRGELCGFLCELGRQLQRGGSFDLGTSLPLSRSAIANALGISLTRAKRALALLTLSRVIETDGNRLTVIDWKRACDYAKFDPVALKVCPVEQEEELKLVPQEPRVVQTTLSGEPANFA
jgi:hypothetical protein